LKTQEGFTGRYTLKGLEEDLVFREIDLRMGLAKKLSPAARKIVSYAFSEMLNNAIDHSHSRKGSVRLSYGGQVDFEIIDRGIGVFESVRRKFKLKNHFEAAEHLLKGKQTTFPERHSGRGIFFTSKIADCFSLESGRLALTIDNRVHDVILKDSRPLKGTRVTFSLSRQSRKDLKALFDEYSDSEFEFDRTRLRVRLSEEDDIVSRSQARRILFGIEKFKRIVLDFKKVKGIGQGFADEVFRVFQSLHPDIVIEAVNTSPSVDFMIRRAKK
jgi:anti-sigma regulatory factor (Ser/Thr protein kinase)